MKSTCLLVALTLVALFTFSNADFIECEMCEMSVKVVVPLLGEDTKDIENAVDAECKKEFHKIPFATKKCKDFVNSKLDPIIKELENGTAPKDVCTNLKMC